MTNKSTANAIRILRMRDVVALTGLSRSTIYTRLADATSAFPRPIRLGGSDGKRCAVGFRSDDIEAWLCERQRAGISSAKRGKK